MSAVVVFGAYGSAEVLELVEVDEPQAAPGQVRVRVRAAGVQPFDCKVRAGEFDWVPVSFPQQLGNELAGVIDQVGDGVERFAIGDAVLGYTSLAAYAELAAVPADQLVHKPDTMPWELAGVLSASGQTAHTALDALRVGAADTLLIHAAAGGAGTFAVQLARERGATVIGTASERNHDYLRSLDAEPVAYGAGLVERVRALAPGGVDAALDAVGTDEAVDASLALVADRDRIMTIVAMEAAAKHGFRAQQTERSTATLEELVRLHEARGLRVPIQAFPLADVAAAHREVESGHVRGKVVLVP